MSEFDKAPFEPIPVRKVDKPLTVSPEPIPVRRVDKPVSISSEPIPVRGELRAAGLGQKTKDRLKSVVRRLKPEARR